MKQCMLIVAFLFTLWGCGPQHAGGSGVDIPNSFTITVSQSDGSPAANAKVRIVALSRWANLVAAGNTVVLDSTTTDSNGKFVVKNPGSTRVNLEVVTNQEGLSVAFDTSLQQVELHSLGSIRAQWNAKAAVRIFGTSYVATADSEGSVNLAGIPSMRSGFVGIAEGQSPSLLGSFLLNAGDSLDLGLLQSMNDSLLVDDFEQKSVQTELDPWLKGSYWFSIADENSGGKSTISPSTAQHESWIAALTDSAAAQGHSLTLHYQIHYITGVSSYAVAGCTLGFGLNADAFDSLEFQVHSDAPYALSDGTNQLQMALPTSGQDWETVVVRRADLASAGISGEIGLLQFVFNDSTGSVFRLDNFRIFGNPFQMLQSAQ